MKTVIQTLNQYLHALRALWKSGRLPIYAGIIILSGCATTPSVCPDTVQTAVEKSLGFETQGACTEGCWQQKRELFLNVAQLCPANAEAYQHLGRAEMQLRHYPEALAAFENAIRIDPSLFEVYFLLGDLAMQSGDYAEAVTYYNQGLQLNPADPLNKGQQRDLAENLAKSVHTNGMLKSADMIAILGGPGEVAPNSGEVGLVRSRVMNSVLSTENRRLVLQIPFDVGSAQPKPEAKPILYELGVSLREILANSESKTAVFSIEGHTDSTGSPERNLALSEQRANQIKQILINNFRIKPQRLAIMPYGQTRPISRGSKSSDHARNRRVEVVRIPDVPDMAQETSSRASP